MANKREIVKYNKDVIIREAAAIVDQPIGNVKRVYDALLDSMISKLATTTKDNDVHIKLGNGVALKGIYYDAKEKVSNITGKTMYVPACVKPKVRFTKKFVEMLTESSGI